MSEDLPRVGFKWVSAKEIDLRKKKKKLILEVNLFLKFFELDQWFSTFFIPWPTFKPEVT